MDIFVDNLYGEVRHAIESQDPDIMLDDEEVEGAISIFPDLEYFYRNISIKNLLRDGCDFDSRVALTSKRGYDRAFEINLANPLFIGIKESKKLLRNKRLEDALNSEGIRNPKISDIEFFEMNKDHFFILDQIRGDNDDRINYSNLTSQHKRLIRQFYEAEYDQIKGDLENFANFDLTVIIDYLTEDLRRVDNKLFTAFLDTEKIHIQFLEFEYRGESHKVLGYFGYGNHYPFGRIQGEKDISSKRFMREDYLDESRIAHFKKEIKRPHLIRSKELLSKIDFAQMNYSQYFEDNFSYEQRSSEISGINSKADNFFMLNPQSRSKGTALIAYKYFLDHQSL